MTWHQKVGSGRPRVQEVSSLLITRQLGLEPIGGGFLILSNRNELKRRGARGPTLCRDNAARRGRGEGGDAHGVCVHMVNTWSGAAVSLTCVWEGVNMQDVLTAGEEPLSVCVCV